MILRPQDLLVSLKFATGAASGLSTAILAEHLWLSTGEVHGAIQRAIKASLLVPVPGEAERSRRGRPARPIAPNREALIELVTHGVRYVFVAERGRITRGMPTAHAAPPLDKVIRDSGPLPVWPDARGTVRGESFSPLYPAAVQAARMDSRLYELLALVDGIRFGSARVRKLAIEMFEQRVRGHQ